LIQGSEDFGSSLRRIASGVLIDIANQLLRVFVIQKAINAISSILNPAKAVSGFAPGVGFNPNVFSMPSLLGRAMGGSVRAGQPYLVGERGPELFMPGRSGGIAPTGSFGGGVNVVVNVDASGSSVQGDDQRANQLGRIVSVAVQQEIVKQKRPGGLLA
jgi:phage-related minor tail protein